ncbi:CoA-disulfide reductase [uncultured Ilyobacter sp.]|uniref:CoA-disulfide reductase n=1 Tax=uncultured Ilyobacter sp. TaxID=544433 RepID=UPI0029C05D5A|nr:CoA-disulfide reductase [uncultured Ilyobacter sp.]
MKILIVGGVAGGASAAARLRRINEDAEIVMFERGEYISFANCGLPYHIGGVIKDRENLLVQTIEGMKTRFNIDVKIKTEVTKIDRENKKIYAKNLKTGETFEESYDRLLLSPGAAPFIPPIPGVNSPNIFSLRNMSDMDSIINHIEKNSVKRAVVVGAGFIGIEVAENLLERDIEVSILEKAPQVLTMVDEEIAAQVHQNIKDKEVELYLEDGVTQFEDVEGKTVVKLESGKEITADMVVMAIGVKPENDLAKEAGLETGKKGGITVNQYLQTSDENIYAVGDAIEVKHYLSGEESIIPLAWPANRQGRIVADNMLGINLKAYNGSLGTSIIKAFDTTVAATGMNERYLKTAGTEYMVATINRNSHASYYPGGVPITLKLLFTKDGDILGAQGLGCKGVDKRIDVIATAIKGKMKVWDLQDLELAYAPPYNSAKDPVNILGYVAENMIKGEVETIRYFQIEDYQKNNNVQLLDIRTKDENELGSIPDSMHLDLAELRDNLSKLDKDKEYIVYCQVGLRGYIAYRMLVQHGFKAKNLDGGYKLWQYTKSEQSNRDIFNDKDQFKHKEASCCKTVSELIDEEREMNKIIEVDACGLQCPGPILKTKKTMESIGEGEVLSIKATDPGFKKDIATWSEKTGNKLLDVQLENGIVTAHVKKGGESKNPTLITEKDTQTMVVFSGDLDKILASFIIANGALAMGKKVSMFFTFWGLNALRKENYTNKNKGVIDKMFGMMMPKGVNKLKLSKMNMGGMGTAMMKYVMKEKNVDSLEKLMKTYLENGGKITACTMSMDVMGIAKEELIEGIEYGGVASYLGDSQEAYSNLFI